MRFNGRGGVRLGCDREHRDRTGGSPALASAFLRPRIAKKQAGPATTARPLIFRPWRRAEDES